MNNEQLHFTEALRGTTMTINRMKNSRTDNAGEQGMHRQTVKPPRSNYRWNDFGTLETTVNWFRFQYNTIIIVIGYLVSMRLK